jgi:hypothetical protein
MESVSRDLNQQMERLAAFEFIQAMALDRKDRSAADWLAGWRGIQEKVSSSRTRTLCFFYTGAWVEAENEAGEEFGMKRLEALLVREPARGLEEILAKVEETIAKHGGQIDAVDDATMMVLKIGELPRA